MSKEDFFEIFGELDDNIVKRAKKSMKRTKKVNWKILGTMAACFILVCTTIVYFFYTNHDADNIIEQSTADIAPMVYVNNTLYIQSSDQQSYLEWKDEFIYLGKIKSTISSENAPKQNFQANDPIVGCEVYQYGENLVIQINGTYRLYIKYVEPEFNWNELSEQEKEELEPTYQGQ